MKGTEIHNGLQDKEIRDFLSKALAKSYKEEYNFEKKEIVGENTQERTISRLENDIEYSKHQIKVNKDRLAILRIMEQKNWKELDVSDYIGKVDDMYLSFIGTVEEGDIIYEKLEKQEV
jgi:hypothetical protein